MLTCHDCGHEDMVHWMFAGCCLVVGCPCLGMDGKAHCTEQVHAAEHDTFQLRPPPTTELEWLARRKGIDLPPEQISTIVALSKAGHGSRPIARQTGVPRSLVIAVIHQEIGKGPATMPRTRPRQEDRERALAAGITAEEFSAERVEGGRARTIDALNAWIAERDGSRALG